MKYILFLITIIVLSSLFMIKEKFDNIDDKHEDIMTKIDDMKSSIDQMKQEIDKYKEKLPKITSDLNRETSRFNSLKTGYQSKIDTKKSEVIQNYSNIYQKCVEKTQQVTTDKLKIKSQSSDFTIKIKFMNDDFPNLYQRLKNAQTEYDAVVLEYDQILKEKNTLKMLIAENEVKYKECRKNKLATNPKG